MKTRTYLRMIAVVLATLLATTVVHAAEPTSYLLLCKAGNNAIKIDNRMENLTDSVRVTSAYINYDFTKSNRPASAGLTTGTCAWADRGINADEPSSLNLHFAQARLVSTVTLSKGEYKVSLDAQGRGQGKADLSRFIAAFQSGQEFQVHAYNNGRGALVATKFGP